MKGGSRNSGSVRGGGGGGGRRGEARRPGVPGSRVPGGQLLRLGRRNTAPSAADNEAEGAEPRDLPFSPCRGEAIAVALPPLLLLLFVRIFTFNYTSYQPCHWNSFLTPLGGTT